VQTISLLPVFVNVFVDILLEMYTKLGANEAILNHFKEMKESERKIE